MLHYTYTFVSSRLIIPNQGRPRQMVLSALSIRLARGSTRMWDDHSGHWLLVLPGSSRTLAIPPLNTRVTSRTAFLTTS